MTPVFDLIIFFRFTPRRWMIGLWRFCARYFTTTGSASEGFIPVRNVDMYKLHRSCRNLCMFLHQVWSGWEWYQRGGDGAQDLDDTFASI